MFKKLSHYFQGGWTPDHLPLSMKLHPRTTPTRIKQYPMSRETPLEIQLYNQKFQSHEMFINYQIAEIHLSWL